MFADPDQATKLIRDPVAPARRSEAAMKKVCSRTLDDGTPAPTFQITITANPKQKHALELIAQIKM